MLTDEQYALKRVAVKREQAGVSVSALQEIKLMSALDHVNVVRLVDVLRTEHDDWDTHHTPSHHGLILSTVPKKL